MFLERDDTIRVGKFNPGFDTQPFNADHTSVGTKKLIPGGYSKGQQLHHIMGVQDHLRPLIQGLPEQQQKGIINRLRSKGVTVGQDPNNLIALDAPAHSAVHRHMEEIGIDSNGILANLAFLNKVSNLKFKDRLIAADTFAEQIYPAIVEELAALGHKVSSPEENIRRYEASIRKEAADELRRHYVEKTKEKFGIKGAKDMTNKKIREIRDHSVGRDSISGRDKNVNSGDIAVYGDVYTNGKRFNGR